MRGCGTAIRRAALGHHALSPVCVMSEGALEERRQNSVAALPATCGHTAPAEVSSHILQVYWERGPGRALGTPAVFLCRKERTRPASSAKLGRWGPHDLVVVEDKGVGDPMMSLDLGQGPSGLLQVTSLMGKEGSCPAPEIRSGSLLRA